MDPDANLREQIDLACWLVDQGPPEEEADLAAYQADANRLCELVLALDEWIRKGGFLPARWTNSEPTKS